MTQAFNLALLANNVNTSGQLNAATGLYNATPVANGGTGAATLTANNLLVGNGTSAVAFIAPGTNGNTLVSNGTVWQSTAAPYAGSKGQVFTSSGTFTVPTGVTAVKVTVVGGGGNGGAGNVSTSSPGGGGGGGVAIRYITGLTPGNTVAVTVGGVGGTSSFGAYCSATGGVTPALNGAGGAGGTATGGDINLSGGTGGEGYANVVNGYWLYAGSSGGGSGAGGKAMSGSQTDQILSFINYPASGQVGVFGSGAYGKNTAGAGIAATGYGNGGGGALSGAYAGGAGTPGIVVVEW
jgi:hypothetical protein